MQRRQAQFYCRARCDYLLCPLRLSAQSAKIFSELFFPFCADIFPAPISHFSLSAQKKFVTKFVTLITKFVTYVSKFVIYVTKFVTKTIYRIV